MSAEKQVLLYTASTPNGFCASILLEEIKSAYPDFDYEYVSSVKVGDLTDLSQSQQN